MSGVTKAQLLQIAGLVKELYWRSNHAMSPDAWTDGYADQVAAVFKRQGIDLGIRIGPCGCDGDPMRCYVDSKSKHRPRVS